jgi:hypothetical protein
MGDDDARPISDKALRLTALRTLFPEMRISLVPGRIDDSWPRKRNEGVMRFPDALASEQIYEVTGAAMNQAEREASENVTDQETFEIRQLRFELFRWPKERDTGFLAVAQYKFPEAWPARMSVDRIAGAYCKSWSGLDRERTLSDGDGSP